MKPAHSLGHATPAFLEQRPPAPVRNVADKQIALGFLARDLQQLETACRDHPQLMVQVSRVQRAAEGLAVWVFENLPDIIPNSYRSKREYKVVLADSARTLTPAQRNKVSAALLAYNHNHQTER